MNHTNNTIHGNCLYTWHFLALLHVLCKSSNLVNGSTIYKTRATLEGEAIWHFELFLNSRILYTIYFYTWHVTHCFNVPDIRKRRTNYVLQISTLYNICTLYYERALTRICSLFVMSSSRNVVTMCCCT
jgi:hypothetical protein